MKPKSMINNIGLFLWMVIVVFQIVVLIISIAQVIHPFSIEYTFNNIMLIVLLSFIISLFIFSLQPELYYHIVNPLVALYLRLEKHKKYLEEYVSYYSTDTAVYKNKLDEIKQLQILMNAIWEGLSEKEQFDIRMKKKYTDYFTTSDEKYHIANEAIQFKYNNPLDKD